MNYIGMLQYALSGWGIVGICLAWLVVLTISIFNCRLLPRRLTYVAEFFRILLVASLLFILAKPEWIVRQTSPQIPEVFILWDNSRSMETSDVEDSLNVLMSRREFVKRLIDSTFWKSLERDNKVVVRPFATPEKDNEGKYSPLSGTDFASTLEEVYKESDNLRAVIMISDGDKTVGKSVTNIVQKYRSKEIPIFTIPVGSHESLPDISIENVTPPSFGILGETVQIPFTVRSTMGQPLLAVISLKSGQEQVQKEIKLPAYGEVTDTILWRIKKEGAESLTLSLPLYPGERAEKNNSSSFVISGRRENIHVLLIESEPRWEYRFIRNALNRDPGVQVDTLLFHPTIGIKAQGQGYLSQFPSKIEELSKYDVIFVGDVGRGSGGLADGEAQMICDMVHQQASGVVFLPGKKRKGKEWQGTPLGDLMPVFLEQESSGHMSALPQPLLLTDAGKKSLLTLLADNEKDNDDVWRNLPGFYWYAPVLRAKAGSLVLATHITQRNKYGKIPLLVTKSAGAGKVLYMGTDAAWRWRRGVEDLYHYRFWGQVARWMSYQRNMASGERVRLMTNRERPNVGDTVVLTAHASDSYGAPLTQGNVSVDVILPGGKKKSTLTMKPIENSWGVYSGELKIDAPGEWKLSAYTSDSKNDAVALNLYTSGDVVEKIGRIAYPEWLKELSLLTRGRVVYAEEAESLCRDILLQPSQRFTEKRYRLWCHWGTGVWFIVLLIFFWTVRKINGTL